MKIEKIVRPILNCDNHRLTTAVYKLDVCFDKPPIYLCDGCLEKLKELEVTRTTEFLYNYRICGDEIWNVTYSFFTSEDEVKLFLSKFFHLPKRYFTVVPILQSKRERKE